jgi:membrane protein implicated in regulation of membrane protease activity
VQILAKYLTLQVPGWGGVGLVLWLLVRFADLPSWGALTLFALFVVKDLVLFPFLRHAYGNDPSHMIGPDALIGAEGVAEDELAPSGWVRVRGERWRAALVGSAGASVARGQVVVVRGVRGLTVQVEPAGGPAQESRDT